MYAYNIFFRVRRQWERVFNYKQTVNYYYTYTHVLVYINYIYVCLRCGGIVPSRVLPHILRSPLSLTLTDSLRFSLIHACALCTYIIYRIPHTTCIYRTGSRGNICSDTKRLERADMFTIPITRPFSRRLCRPIDHAVVFAVRILYFIIYISEL